MENSTHPRKVLVVGGGAAGLLAAYSAASLGAQVHLLEKGDRLGHKLSLTGKGRCNLTNDCSVAQLVQNIPGNGRFLYSAFAVFDSQACQSFFTEIGVPLKVERGGRVFPQSDSATQVVAALTRLLNHHRVQVHYRSPVSHLLFDNTSGDMPTVVGVATPKGEHRGDAIILATGGASYPLTGSRGDGYTLAATAGHTIIPVRGALVPLEMVEKWVPLLQGLSLRNVQLTLTNSQGKVLGTEFGEMLFTHFGVSGPMVLTLSRLLLDATGEYTLTLNLKPALTFEQLDLRLQRDFLQNKNKQFKNSLNGLLPQKMIAVVIELSGITEDKEVNSITREERLGLVRLLQHLPLTVRQTRPIEEAIVTAGGVAVGEVDPKTMASKLCRGLYLAGELLDIDGYTGGYNLQAAFATGFVAGRQAAY